MLNKYSLTELVIPETDTADCRFQENADSPQQKGTKKKKKGKRKKKEREREREREINKNNISA